MNDPIRAGRAWPSPDEQITSLLSGEGIAVLPDYLPEAQWRALARESRALYARRGFRRAGIGRGASFRIAPELRSDELHWIDPQRSTRRQAAWLTRMDGLRQLLNRRLFLGLRGFETHLSVYPPGARYRTHLDRFADAAQRRVSVLLYLNDDWLTEDGGELRLYLEAADRTPWRDVTPRGGTLVAFLSDALPHEVLPARRERWSLAGWFTGHA